jgi:hypothetical protein
VKLIGLFLRIFPTSWEKIMSACYEIETEIPVNHQLVMQLPDSIPVGHAKITIHYELTDHSIQPKSINHHAGKITLREDPLEFQNNIRAEWM